MSRYRRLIITLGVMALMLLTFDAVAARPADDTELPHSLGHPPAGKGRSAHLTWTPRHIIQAVTAGQTIQLTANFTSSADIAEATFVIPGGLGRVLKADTATLTNITAGTLTTVTFTVTMPAKAHTQGGVVQLRAGKRMLPQPLPILLTVANSNDTEQGENDAAEPIKPANGTDTGRDENDTAKPTKPAKPAKPTHP